MKKKVAAVIVCAGSGTRMGKSVNKIFLKIAGKKVIDYTLDAFLKVDAIDQIILVTRECDMDEMNEHIKNIKKDIRVVVGGKTRQESVYNGLINAKDAHIVLIHDGARALITPQIIEDAIKKTSEFGATLTAVPIKDTIKYVTEDGFIEKTLNREKIYSAQTPQSFLYEKIIDAYNKAIKDDFLATDDCALYEKYEGKVKIIDGSYENIKITTPEDLDVAENILKKRGNLI